MQQGLGLNSIFLVIMLGLFYVMVFLPEKKRKKKYNEMLNSISVNDEVITRGGIIGKIVNIKEDYVIIQTGPDRVKVQISKSGILDISKKREDTDKKEDMDKKEEKSAKEDK
ncbi:preprotein translocase subunit YajC [Clostridium botulinum]|uniref:Preprotein translocase subunit YajC n=1 Tax=Clostridium botulinum (strain Hall / ATCC 3502 / NCTC 13319 / Type A) TaxID=441771 RepID=A5I6E8_CLOBH|nr:preprotein translocase subunit YajC [Clostridium botulinum]ABS34688.1 preprotein translocase, YajC subunit [Clostridium botulinum A str. ATCC 19397]ABS38106.1 preprotein translocase, YajC subunit [Clostridium botulinum A str. Hall]AWB18880.1 preprotein translocase subunit YajC [Clostridium botulinum]AWB31694.1 preprotein translocase subunit YajC [Clostridium botulinum]EGT5616319.1 preprotein translocase subunit YajC [Clostridium botulinum]